MSAVAASGYSSYTQLLEVLPAGSIFSQDNVPWATYLRLVELELPDLRRFRVSYDRGRLEIMGVSSEHESYTGLFTHLIQILTEELGLNYAARGSMTMINQKSEKGTEADDCFYVGDLARILGIKRINLDVDAQPDIAVEVDITNPTLDKLPIYSALGVVEVWRYCKGQIEFYQLAPDGSYQLVPFSKLFPFLTNEVIADALKQGDAEGINLMRISFRQWVQAHKP